MKFAALPRSVAVLSLLASGLAFAQTENVIWSFGVVGNIGGPQAGVITDPSGNIFGSSPGGFYELTPNSSGSYDETTLYSVPVSSLALAEGDLVRDATGNLYGVVTGGESNDGLVLEFTPQSDGTYQTKTLYTFPTSGKRGFSPYNTLTLDSAGNIFGTTAYGGVYEGSNHYSGGTAFALTPKAGGGYTQRVIHSFENGSDGVQPTSRLTLGSHGILYGVAASGGKYGDGIAFALQPNGNGGYNERIIHNFGNGSDGQHPGSDLILDSSGNLFGTTFNGGISANGVVFELSPKAGGGWTETILHRFASGSGDGQGPGDLIFDSAGNLYGNTAFGGLYFGGVLYELVPSGGGWTESVVYNFGSGSDGYIELGSLFRDASGNIYGTNEGGGTSTSGTIWEFIP
jgi:uncharacterized repeat protein (TIGR03803 family)